MSYFAKMLYSDGSFYEGHWKNGLREGQGKVKYNEGNLFSSYEGEYHKDVRSGMGKMAYEDGGVYEGHWEDGKKEGRGKYTYPSGNPVISYEGEFHNNVENGLGKKVFANGSVVVGLWKNNVPSRVKKVFGLAGMTASGKSTIAASLTQRVPNSVVLESDAYYNTDKATRVPFAGTTVVDWENPAMMDWDRLHEDILKADAEVVFVDSFLLFYHLPLVKLLTGAVVISFRQDEAEVACTRRVERLAVRGRPLLEWCQDNTVSKDPKVIEALYFRELAWPSAWHPANRWMHDGSGSASGVGPHANSSEEIAQAKEEGTVKYHLELCKKVEKVVLYATEDKDKNVQMACDFIGKLVRQ